MLDVPKTSEKSFADGKILQSVSDGVGVITFNNPEKRNAMSLEMWEGLIMYTGMRIDSAEAVRIGLVDRVLPDSELWEATVEIARTISDNAPLAIKAAKLTIAQVLKDESRRDMAAIKAIGTACMDSE